MVFLLTQGNLPPHGTRDVRIPDDTEQHDWSQLAEAPNVNSTLSVNRPQDPYNLVKTAFGSQKSRPVFKVVQVRIVNKQEHYGAYKC